MIFHSNIVILVWIIFRCFAKETWVASAFQIPFLSADPNPGKRLVLFNKKEASHAVKHGSSKQFLANNAEALQQIFRDRGSPSKNMTLEILLCQPHLNHFCGLVSVSFLSFFPFFLSLWIHVVSNIEFICLTLQYWDPITFYKIIMIVGAFVYYRLFNLLGRQNISEWKICNSSLPLLEKKNQLCSRLSNLGKRGVLAHLSSFAVAVWLPSQQFFTSLIQFSSYQINYGSICPTFLFGPSVSAHWSWGSRCDLGQSCAAQQCRTEYHRKTTKQERCSIVASCIHKPTCR